MCNPSWGGRDEAATKRCGWWGLGSAAQRQLRHNYQHRARERTHNRDREREEEAELQVFICEHAKASEIETAKTQALNRERRRDRTFKFLFVYTHVQNWGRDRERRRHIQVFIHSLGSEVKRRNQSGKRHWQHIDLQGKEKWVRQFLAEIAAIKAGTGALACEGMRRKVSTLEKWGKWGTTLHLQSIQLSSAGEAKRERDFSSLGENFWNKNTCQLSCSSGEILQSCGHFETGKHRRTLTFEAAKFWPGVLWTKR